MKIFYWGFLLSLFFCSFNCVAQVSVSGRVINQVDNKPVANASVFISNATIGNKTAADGTFSLYNLRAGKYELVVSIIGFETFSQSLIVDAADIKLPDIVISPKIQMLDEVKIKPVDDRNRQLYLGWFKEEFLGKSNLAKQCKIINPEMLDFDYNQATGVLKSSSVDFLVIQNSALGYNIKYLLANFTLNNRQVERVMSYKGFVLFEKMKGSLQQEKDWQKARLEVYGNSSMHFLRSVINNQVEEQGFKVQQLAVLPNPERPADSLINAKIRSFRAIKSKDASDSLVYWLKKSKLNKEQLKLNPFPLDRAEFAQKADKDGFYALSCENDGLFVTYNKARHFNKKTDLGTLSDSFNTDNSVIDFAMPYAFFDFKGVITNPESVSLGGVWGRKRIAELLPQDYDDALHLKNEKADSGLINIVSHIREFSSNNSSEKSYLHLDRFNYLPGDTIWYKAYTVLSSTHELSSLSGVLHVELINEKDSVIHRDNLPLDAGIAAGDFVLARTADAGIYRIRAYTNLMRNYNSDGFFDQRIRIGLPVITTALPRQVAVKTPDVQFFPESGELINGLRSKVAVKVLNSNGVGEDVAGTIVDNEGTEAAVFNTQHLGMGAFAFTPQAGKAYIAKITAQNGRSFTADLPKATDDGFILTVNNRKQDSVSIKISAANNTFAAKLHSGYYLIAQSGGKVYYTTSFKLDNPVNIVEIAKDRFPSGIIQFTLLTQTAEPLNERIAFVRSNDTLKLNLGTPGLKFAQRQKVTMNLNAIDDIGLQTSGTFSVSVINENRANVEEDAESTIFNNLLLTSDLKGYIEKPNYYFNKITEQTEADLDLLMLTQGYRRFEWKDVLNNKAIQVNYPVEKTLELAGTLKTPSGKPVANGKVNLFANKEGFFKDTVTDIGGNFRFKDLELSEAAKLVLQARKQNDGKNVAIFIKQPDYPLVDRVLRINKSIADQNLPPEQMAALQEDYAAYIKQHKTDSLQGIALNEIIVKGKKTLRQGPVTKFGTLEEHAVDMKKLRGPQFYSLKDALFWVAPQTHELPGFSHRNAENRDNPNERTDFVVIDGIVRSKSFLNNYSPQEIEDVHLVYRNPSIRVPLIVVITKRAAGTDTTVLKEVKIQATKLNKKPDLAFSSNLNGPGNADQILMGNKLNGCVRLSDCLNGKLFGVSFDASGNPLNSRTGKGMSVVINGSVLSGQALNNISYGDVYSVEVLRSASYISIYGSSMPGGALVITTNRGTQGFVTSESPEGLITYTYKGYHKARSFYSPKYENNFIAPASPDLRTTIYWHPNIITDHDGKASFTYFNGDAKGTYRIVVEGINGEGKLGRQVYRYLVE